MKITFLPKARLGKTAVLLILVSWILFIFGSLMPSQEGLTGWDNVIHNPIQTVLTVLLVFAGLAAPIMALVAVIKQQERSILVFLVIPTIFSSLIMAVGLFLSQVMGFVL